MWTSKQRLIGEELGNAERGRVGHGREIHSIVAGYSEVNWDHPSSSGLCGGMHICVCTHVCPDAGADWQAGRNICSGP